MILDGDCLVVLNWLRTSNRSRSRSSRSYPVASRCCAGSVQYSVTIESCLRSCRLYGSSHAAPWSTVDYTMPGIYLPWKIYVMKWESINCPMCDCFWKKQDWTSFAVVTWTIYSRFSRSPAIKISPDPDHANPREAIPDHQERMKTICPTLRCAETTVWIRTFLSWWVMFPFRHMHLTSCYRSVPDFTMQILYGNSGQINPSYHIRYHVYVKAYYLHNLLSILFAGWHLSV